MGDSEFYHEALIRRIRERDDCDDDLRGACDEIEDCYETIERLRLTDTEQEALAELTDDPDYYGLTRTHAKVLRGLLERLK